jgi:hypothetical protein
MIKVPTNPQLHTDRIFNILHKGLIHIEGQFIIGTNFTFLASVEFQKSKYHAVYKPQKGEVPLWDFPPNTLASREIAAFLISEAVAWRFVPPTIMRKVAPLGPGSLQWYIPHNPDMNYFTFNDTIKDTLQPVVIFDMIINNADRKGSHIIIGEDKRIWLIDHGICFHHENKLRTVVWDFIKQPIPNNIIQDIKKLKVKLSSNYDLINELKKLLSKQEITAMKDRIQRIIENPIFPLPRENYRPFPYPLL